jgi:uncharacterized protein (DUF58 family)
MIEAEDAAFLDYRARWRAGETRPGKHAARHAGSGGDFRAFRPFWQLPDAQRIDLRRSLMDPAGTIMVRQTDQRSSITLILAIDVSRSMVPARAAPLAASAARAASRAGDAFGLLCFDEALRTDITIPPTRRRGAAADAAATLTSFKPVGRHAEGLRDVASTLPRQPCLVLLVSDFLMPPETITTGLSALARHHVTPVVLTTMPQDIPSAGLCRIRDAETGQTRLLLMRPALRRRWREAAAARRVALNALFASHGRDPFHAGSTVDIAALSRHLAAA